MILRLCTRRNTCGHRNYLIIDTDRRIYATEPHGWYNKADYVEVSAADLKKAKEATEADNYTRKDYL